MNKIDKEHYKYLKAFSQIPRNNSLEKFKTKNIKRTKIKDYMEGTIWDELRDLGYVTSSLSVKNIITLSGLEQLRILEDMRRKELTLVFSIVAIILSILSFAKSMRWI
ncbi:MAG: hypothetical protein KJ939_03835 [Nanoarchaeota archaeon]|nr:hypothetical protein [Nanoarchaeota archaeon]